MHLNSFSMDLGRDTYALPGPKLLASLLDLAGLKEAKEFISKAN